MNLGIDGQHRDPWLVLTPLGDLDMASAPALRQRVVAAVAAGDRWIVIDLGSVDFVDSVGIGVLVGALRRTRANEGGLVLARPTNAVRDVLASVDLDRVFMIHRDVDRAVATAPGGER